MEEPLLENRSDTLNSSHENPRTNVLDVNHRNKAFTDQIIRIKMESRENDRQGNMVTEGDTVKHQRTIRNIKRGKKPGWKKTKLHANDREKWRPLWITPPTLVHLDEVHIISIITSIISAGCERKQNAFATCQTGLQSAPYFPP